MKPARQTFVALLLGCAAHGAQAEIEASLDLRLVDSDGRNSYLDGGLGKLRYDNDDDGLQLGRARFAWRGGIGGDWHASVDLSAGAWTTTTPSMSPRGWLEWRPVPSSAWRSNLKIGAFYAPISLEHRASGWTNPYTIDSSALNTWWARELRTIGIGYELEHLGIAAGGRFDYGVSAAVFGWNDPAGVVLAFRGFSLNDRQTPLFGRIGTYAYGGREQRVIFSEIDDRPGYHVGAYIKSDSGVELRGLHYDNRADPSVEKPSIEDYAWHTEFDSLGLALGRPAWDRSDCAVAGRLHPRHAGSGQQLGLQHLVRAGGAGLRQASLRRALRPFLYAPGPRVLARPVDPRRWQGHHPGLDLERSRTCRKSRPNGCACTATTTSAPCSARRRMRWSTACSWRYGSRCSDPGECSEPDRPAEQHRTGWTQALRLPRIEDGLRRLRAFDALESRAFEKPGSPP